MDYYVMYFSPLLMDVSLSHTVVLAEFQKYLELLPYRLFLS